MCVCVFVCKGDREAASGVGGVVVVVVVGVKGGGVDVVVDDDEHTGLAWV